MRHVGALKAESAFYATCVAQPDWMELAYSFWPVVERWLFHINHVVGIRT